jgi:hypothetical protein
MSDVVYRLMMNDLQARRVSPATTPVAQAA